MLVDSLDYCKLIALFYKLRSISNDQTALLARVFPQNSYFAASKIGLRDIAFY